MKAPSILTEQHAEPFLRLNTTMHTAVINRINTDAIGKYLLTASDDKTAKLWDTDTGELFQTLRLPIGEGNEGMVFAGALSPNDKIAAVGGSTGKSGINCNIYLFDITTGLMVQRLGGLDNEILDLEFSPDGAYLAAGLRHGSGVTIFKKNLSGFEHFKSLTGYGYTSHNVAFDQTGRFVTVCYDCKIRLYDNKFKLITETTGTGLKPFSVAFSPDGNKIAVAYEDVPDVEVFSGINLHLLYKPRLGSMNTNGGFLNLCYSADGKYLYGGGYYGQNLCDHKWYIIRQWDEASGGSYCDYPVSDNTIMDIKALPGGNILFGSARPDFGQIDVKGNILYYKAAETNKYNAIDNSHFKVNIIGDEIAFWPLRKEALRFSVSKRQLKLAGTEILTDLKSYTDQKNIIIITDWQDSCTTKISGSQILFLEQYEHCQSVDISSDDSNIVFGADWNIYCTDALGSKQWKTPSQGTVCAVNITGNGLCVAAAIGDGTIKWYRMCDGKELLTLFAHPDNKRWILYTPSGYYDCAPGAEEMIGWHLNRGADKEAYLFPVSKFRTEFYRPDIIENILLTYDEDEAIRMASLMTNRMTSQTSINNMLPPVVKILNPDFGQEVNSTLVPIRYSAISPNGDPITSVKVLIDGRPSDVEQFFKPKGAGNESQILINIPKKDVTISVLAKNLNGWSEAASYNLKWKGAIEQDLFQPTLYILAIGVSNYNDEELRLLLAAKDAEDFITIMKAQKGGLYKEVQVQLLPDAKATRTNIIKGLKWLKTQTTSKDTAMLFFSGHGITDTFGTFYYIPVEADINEIEATCVMFAEIKNTVSIIPGKIIVFVDACHSGSSMGGRCLGDINGMINELIAVENGAIVFTSSTGKQYSFENAEWGNGAFTKALVEGLSGKADLFKRGKITIKALDAYVADRVQELTGGNQSPTTIIPISIPDFQIGIVK